jgi:hypothetical protein
MGCAALVGRAAHPTGHSAGPSGVEDPRRWGESVARLPDGVPHGHPVRAAVRGGRARHRAQDRRCVPQQSRRHRGRGPVRPSEGPGGDLRGPQTRRPDQDQCPAGRPVGHPARVPRSHRYRGGRALDHGRPACPRPGPRNRQAHRADDLQPGRWPAHDDRGHHPGRQDQPVLLHHRAGHRLQRRAGHVHRPARRHHPQRVG